jgi:hypothetical protein
MSPETRQSGNCHRQPRGGNVSAARRLVRFTVAIIIGLGLSTGDIRSATAVPAIATPAPPAAASTTQVRLAHLAPDTPDLDAYLDPAPGGGQRKVVPGLGYGAVTAYQSIPAGRYTVALRTTGAAASGPPVLSAPADLAGGAAYTLAVTGHRAGLALQVVNDDLTTPVHGNAKLRVVQAASRAGAVTVSMSGGPTVATNVPFATVGGYQQVPPGRWDLRVQPTRGGAPAPVSERLNSGRTYSLLVLDTPGGGGLTLRLHPDGPGNGVPAIGGPRITPRASPSPQPTPTAQSAGRLAKSNAAPGVIFAVAVALIIWWLIRRHARKREQKAKEGRP